MHKIFGIRGLDPLFNVNSHSTFTRFPSLCVLNCAQSEILLLYARKQMEGRKPCKRWMGIDCTHPVTMTHLPVPHPELSGLQLASMQACIRLKQSSATCFHRFGLPVVAVHYVFLRMSSVIMASPLHSRHASLQSDIHCMWYFHLSFIKIPFSDCLDYAPMPKSFRLNV